MTTVTEWRKVALLITKDKATGDAMYLLLRAFQNDPEPTESIFDVQLNDGAWACQILAKQTLTDIVDEFNEGGYPQALIDAGKTEAEIDALRSIVFADTYDLYPDNRARTVQPNALDDFITAKGFARIEQSP